MIRRAMILAAGRGERLRPLTDSTPKPLLAVGGEPLVFRILRQLAAAGVQQVVINLGWLGDRVSANVGDGSRFGLVVHYSNEADGVLETGGGIVRALPLLGDEPFIVINGDVWTDLDLASLRPPGVRDLASLVLVDNPPHNAGGDFALDEGRVRRDGTHKYTFAGIAVYRPEFFSGCQATRFALPPLLFRAADEDRVCGTLHAGRWVDVGTAERLTKLDRQLRAGSAD